MLNLMNEFMFDCWWYDCTCELNDQLLLKLNSYVKNHMYEYVVFLWKIINDEVVVWWFIEWIFMVDCCCWCLKNMLMNWYVEYVIGELMMKVVVVVVEQFWECGEILKLDKIMFDSWVLSIFVYVFMYMTYKLYLGRILSVGGSKLECLGKRVLKFEVFILDWRVFA